MIPDTIAELLKWLKDNCYTDAYAVGGIHIYEGYGLEYNGTAYVWYYTERGQRQELKYFTREKQATAYAFGIIKSDQSAKRHMIGFVKSEQELQRMKIELKHRKIEYTEDVLSYSNTTPKDRYRVFVTGCDIKKVSDLVEI